MDIDPQVIKDLYKKIANNELLINQNNNSNSNNSNISLDQRDAKKYKNQNQPTDKDKRNEILIKFKDSRMEFIKKLTIELEDLCTESSDIEKLKSSYNRAKIQLDEFDRNLNAKWQEIKEQQ